MIIYDLECPLGHRFEGWFPNPEAFEKQSDCGLIECSVCGANDVVRLPSGGHVALTKGAEAKPAPEPSQEEASAPAVRTDESGAADSQEIKVDPVTFARYVRHLIHDKGTDVGDKFADKAIAMHKGIAEAAPIYGSADSEARERLSEEGVAYFPIPNIPDEFDN